MQQDTCLKDPLFNACLVKQTFGYKTGLQAQIEHHFDDITMTYFISIHFQIFL